jgi:small-conductance mechanosensitive channel
MHRWHAFTFALLALVSLTAFAEPQPPKTAQPAPSATQAQDAGSFLKGASQQVAEIRKTLVGEVDEITLNDLRDQASDIGAAADRIVGERSPELDSINARIAVLGPAPEKGAPAERSDIAAERGALEQQRAALDAEIKSAKSISVESQQLAADIAEKRRANFQARLSQRTASPLTPAFWKNIAGNLANDRARLDAVRSGAFTAVEDGFAPDNRLYAMAGIVIAILLIVLGRWWAERSLMRLTSDRMPHGRLRRSALALAFVVVATIFTGFGAEAIWFGLDRHNAFSATENQLARAIVGAVFFGSFVAGLGRALLSPGRPSWRLPEITNEVASAAAPFAWLLGGAIALSIVLRRINSVANASLAATVAASLLSALLYGVIILWALVRIARARRQVPQKTEPKPGEAPPHSLWTTLTLGAAWIAAVIALGAALLGFVAFAQFLAALMVRVLIVGGAFFLLVHLIEDICFTLVGAREKWMRETLGVEKRTLDQVAVVLSGTFRVVAFVFALSLVLAGFGSGRAELSQLGAQFGSSALRIGSIDITPDAVLGAVAVFFLGMLALRALKRWFHDRYLPTTKLDPAMRASVATLLGYAGAIVVFGFALSALGLSVERIAWVASALSVGIGFGLQAVVQNFVSGLILLVERPVKVGDWVALGDVEGDIRRINVRATEIQMGDRSTMIVPNSELITKTVRNVTLANAQGRVQVKLPMPLDTDAGAVIAAMRAAFSSNEAVLENPAMSVTVDGIQNATLIFVGVAFIANPRQAGSIRSDILLDILARLREGGIEMVKPQEVAYRTIGGPAQPATPFES